MAVPLRHHLRFPLLFAARALLLLLSGCPVSESRDDVDAYPYFPVPPEVRQTQTGSVSCPTGSDVGEEGGGGEEEEPILSRKRLLFLDPGLVVPQRRSPGGATDAAKVRFTPWGGKRSGDMFVAVATDRKFHPWSGKRGRGEHGGRQFNPWGGKRNGRRSEGVEDD